MNISKRIYFNSGVTTNIINDKFIQIKLEQNVKTIEEFYKWYKKKYLKDFVV